jgi:hypothetical protein
VFIYIHSIFFLTRDRYCRDRMVVRFTTACITNNDVHSNPAHGEMYSIQHYMIHFVSDLRQVGGFLRVLPPVQHYMIHFVSDLRQVGGFLRVLPPVILITTIQLKHC